MSPFEMVREFHEAFGLPARTEPRFPTPSEASLRVSLISEEFEEVRRAYRELFQRYSGPTEFAALAHELADLVYVAYGAALEMGIDLDAVIAEVHAANMRKLGPGGKPIYSDTGKVLKPEGWERADVHRILFGAVSA